MRTAANAPHKERILVWVADIEPMTKKPVGWVIGRRLPDVEGLPPKLQGEGFNGDWKIYTWHPLPGTPELSK